MFGNNVTHWKGYSGVEILGNVYAQNGERWEYKCPMSGEWVRTGSIEDQDFILDILEDDFGNQIINDDTALPYVDGVYVPVETMLEMQVANGD